MFCSGGFVVLVLCCVDISVVGISSKKQVFGEDTGRKFAHAFGRNDESTETWVCFVHSSLSSGLLPSGEQDALHHHA